MSTKYSSLAEQIIVLVGGADNIEDVYHCQTRLRFKLHDDARADQARLNQTDGVTTSLVSGGVFQVVVGMHVKDVHDEIQRQLTAQGHTVQTKDAEDKPKDKKGFLNVVIDFVTGTFQPIIPALSGAGMIKALLALLVVFNITTRESQTYYVLNFFADAVFYFLPILLAFSAATKLKCNPVLAAALAGIMLHPNWIALVTKGEPVHLFDVIPLTLTNYGGSVIPIILVILVQSVVEKWLHKIVPAAINLVFVPMLTLLIVGTLAMTVLGPIGSILSGYLATFFTFLSTNAAWAPAVIIGALLPVMVMFGLHNAVAPLGVVQMAQTGFDSIFGPGALCSNIAQGVSSLVVAFRTKDLKLRQIASAGGITALMGITEPALYGVNLPKRYPLVAAMIGGGAGGLYAGLTQTHRFATGSSGLPAALLYIGEDTMRHLYNILIALGISAVVTATLTLIFSFKFEKKHPIAAGGPADGTSAGTGTAAAAAGREQVEEFGKGEFSADTLTLVRTDVSELTAPCAGTVVPLGEVADPAFASQAMGPGIGIEPDDGAIVAPCSGTVMVAMDTGHAFGIRTDDGMEVLVHVGIDTVTMKGHGFTGAVAQGSRVQAGQHLVTADLAAIKNAGHPATVILVLTNYAMFGDVTPIATGSVIAGEPVLTVTP